MSNKLTFLIVAVLLIVTIGLAGGFFMMWNKLSSLSAQANAAAAAGAEQNQPALGTLFKLDTFIVNLADQERSRYLRVTMELELPDSTSTGRLEDRLPQIRDSILMILPSKHLADITSMEGKTALRDEIIAKLNGLFAENIISNIFFTEFVVQ